MVLNIRRQNTAQVVLIEEDDVMSYEAVLVQLDVERDSEQRVQLALALADRFQAALIGVAGLALRPAFAAAGIVVYAEPTKHDLHQMSAIFDRMGKKFLEQGQSQTHRMAIRAQFSIRTDYTRGPRGRSHHRCGAAGGQFAKFRRSGRNPVASRAAGLGGPGGDRSVDLHRIVVAWKDTRECRRAVRDAIPFLQQAKEVLLIELGEEEAKSQDKKALADVANYLIRHKVVVAEQIVVGPGARLDGTIPIREGGESRLIVAGGYGHSRLGEWTFGGVTHELLAASSVCCMLSH